MQGLAAHRQSFCFGFNKISLFKSYKDLKSIKSALFVKTEARLILCAAKKAHTACALNLRFEKSSMRSFAAHRHLKSSILTALALAFKIFDLVVYA